MRLLQIRALHPSGATVAHLAAVIPSEDRQLPSRWPVPEGERHYLCGREARYLATEAFPWTRDNEYPTCTRCKKEFERMAEAEEALPYGRQWVMVEA